MFKNKNVILYLIYTLFSSISFISLYTNLYLQENFEFTISQIGIALIIYQATKFIFELPTGVIADKYSKKLSVIIGNLLIILSYVMLLLNKYYLVYISFFLKGIGYTFVSGSFEALFVNSLDNKFLVKINSLERIFFYLGIGISSILGGIIIGIFSFKVIIILDILILFVIFIISVLIKEEKITNNNEKYLLSSLKLIFKEKFLKYFLIIDLIVAISFINIEDFFSVYLSSRGISIEIIGIFIFLKLFLASTIGYIIHNLYKNINKIKVYNIFSILHIVFAILMYVQQNVILVPILYTLSSVSFSMFAPIKYEIFQTHIKDSVRSTVLSIKSLFISIGGIISYFIVFLFGKFLKIEQITLILLIITLLLCILINIILFKDIKIFYKEDTK